MTIQLDSIQLKTERQQCGHIEGLFPLLNTSPHALCSDACRRFITLQIYSASVLSTVRGVLAFILCLRTEFVFLKCRGGVCFSTLFTRSEALVTFVLLYFVVSFIREFKNGFKKLQLPDKQFVFRQYRFQPIWWIKAAVNLFILDHGININVLIQN